MKKIMILIVIIFMTTAVNAQSYEKYNSFYQRTEYFNSNGTMTGYSKENTFYNRIEYFDANGNMTGYEKYNEFYKRWEYTAV